MPKQIYEKTARELFRVMLQEWALQPGQLITAAQIVDWYRERYPAFKRGTIRAHLVQATTNDRNRKHFTTTKASDDLLYRVDDKHYRLYVPGQDPAPFHEQPDAGDGADEGADDVAGEDGPAPTASVRDGIGVASTPAASEFLYERDLQMYLAANLGCIEPGLTLYVNEDLRGIEYPAGGGRIDILAVDREGGFVVLELKVSRGHDQAAGQLLRYVNWVRLELAEPGQRVRGMVVCRTISQQLRLACASVPEIELYAYDLAVTVKREPRLRLS